MRESRLLEHIYRRSRGLEATFPQVIAGPGDDCAVVATPGGERLLLKVDQLIEGRHFAGPLGVGTPLDVVARKALARPLSDIAAAAGTPWAALATAALPQGFDQHHADALFDAMSRWAIHWKCPLVGGDIASIEPGASGENRPAIFTVSILGLAHAGRGIVSRRGTLVGDSVYVTGRIGASLASGRHLSFEPRLTEGRWLAGLLGPHLHAMMDISDGLGRDAARLAEASGVTVELDTAAIPLHSESRDWRTASGDGEDYELLFTAPADASLPPICPATGTAVTRIGRAVARAPGAAACVGVSGGTRIDLSECGWEYV